MCFAGKIRLFCRRFYLKLACPAEPGRAKAARLGKQELMPHNNEQGKPSYRRKRRRNRLIALLLALAAAVYSGLWYFIADRAADKLAAAIGRAALNGVDIRCRDLQKSGYPLRVSISCIGLSVAQQSSAAAEKTGRHGGQIMSGKAGAPAFRSAYLTAGAPVYAPHWLLAEIGAPAVLELPGSRPITADWQKLQCEGDCAAAPPRNITISAESLSIGNLPFLPPPAPLTADFIRLGSKKRNGDKAVFTLSFNDLLLPYIFPGGRAALPKADGSLEIIGDRAEAFYARLPQLLHQAGTSWLRGQSLHIKKLVLTFADGGGFSLSGPLAITPDGRINGKITVSIADAAALLRTIRSVFPAQADNLESLFFVLNSMPKNDKGEPQLVLDIMGSHMRIGFIKLGKIPPL